MATSDVTRAFVVGNNKSSGNHMVTHDGDRSHYYLHGSKIATWDRAAGTVWIGHAGYPTVTTAKAVNAILNECGWLGATMKAWEVTDATGAKAKVGDTGLTFHRRKISPDKDGFGWTIEAPTPASGLAPTLAK